MNYLAKWLVLSGGLLLKSNSMLAQTPDSTSTLCVLYIEKMPELRSGGKSISIVQAVQQRLTYPPAAIQARAEGRVFISFTIAPNGLVRAVHLIKGFRPDCDSAALEAVRRLPRFKPAIQLNKPVACGYTVPVKFSLPSKAKPAK